MTSTLSIVQVETMNFEKWRRRSKSTPTPTPWFGFDRLITLLSSRWHTQTKVWVWVSIWLTHCTWFKSNQHPNQGLGFGLGLTYFSTYFMSSLVPKPWFGFWCWFDLLYDILQVKPTPEPRFGFRFRFDLLINWLYVVTCTQTMGWVLGSVWLTLWHTSSHQMYSYQGYGVGLSLPHFFHLLKVSTCIPAMVVVLVSVWVWLTSSTSFKSPHDPNHGFGSGFGLGLTYFFYLS